MKSVATTATVPQTDVSRPENGYRDAADFKTRRVIQIQVLSAYRGHVAAYVRRRLPVQHRTEAEHVGSIGLLVALEKFDASRGVPFWAFAVNHVYAEVQRWIDHGVNWRASTRGAKGRSVHPEHRRHASMDAAVGEAETTLHDVIMSTSTSIDDLVATAEGLARVTEFLGTLNRKERHLLLSEKRERGNPNSPWVRRFQALVERGATFVSAGRV